MPSNDWMNPYTVNWPTEKAALRAYSTARHLADKPSIIIITRDGTALAAQTVRIEGKSGVINAGQVYTDLQQTYTRTVTVFGLPTLNIATGDRFGYQGDTYSVTGVTAHAGEIQAQAERYQT